MMIMVIFIMMYLYDQSAQPISFFPKKVFLFLTDAANANAVATLQTSTAVRPATTVTGLAAEHTRAAPHSSPEGVRQSSPSRLSSSATTSDSCGQTRPCSRRWCGPSPGGRGARSPPPGPPPPRTGRPPSPRSRLQER